MFVITVITVAMQAMVRLSTVFRRIIALLAWQTTHVAGVNRAIGVHVLTAALMAYTIIRNSVVTVGPISKAQESMILQAF
jgi:hypothetical protein